MIVERYRRMTTRLMYLKSFCTYILRPLIIVNIYLDKQKKKLKKYYKK